jgi:hypothetical protein
MENDAPVVGPDAPTADSRMVKPDKLLRARARAGTICRRVRSVLNGRVPDYLHFILRCQHLAGRESLTAGYRVQGESSGKIDDVVLCACRDLRECHASKVRHFAIDRFDDPLDR